MIELKDSVKTYKPYTLEYPSWLFGTGFSKGIYHDRQSLGIALPAGASFSIRRSSPMDTVLELDMLNDSGSTETYVRITGEWTTLTVTSASVPFIRTPYIPIDVQIEYSAVGEHVLPTYRAGDDADLFFRQWDETDSAFTLVQTTYANLLVPAVDKSRLKELHQAEGLGALEAYYVNVFEYFNRLAGISLDATVPTDKNILNRYFIKADKDGGGSAYYGQYWTAQVAATIAPCWLDTRPDNWCALHEIAHGYQTLAMYNSSIPTGEVWNNIYATYYQHKMMGDSVYERGWMYGGDAQATFDAVRSRIDSDVPLSMWPLSELLFIFMLVIDKVGEPAFTEFNQYYRRLANAEGFNYLTFPLEDIFVTRWAERTNLDVGPFMTQVGANVTNAVSFNTAYGNYQPCCPLYRVVPPEQLASIQRRLKLKTPLSLVDCKSLLETDLKGDVTLRMTERAYFENKGKSLVIRTGSNISRVVKVISPTLEVKGLPIGVYTLQPPAMTSGNLIKNYTYVEVAANMNNLVELDSVLAKGTSLASQTIDFLGLGDGKIATLCIDMESCRASFSVVSTTPHSYFGSATYASVLVRDLNGFILCDVVLPGVGALVGVYEFPIAPGCTVNVHHQEPVRLREVPRLQPFIDLKAIDNFLEVTTQGFKNIKMGSWPADNLKTRIAAAADEIRKTPHVLLHAGSAPVMDVFAAIHTFDGAEKDTLIGLYKDLIISYADTGGPVVSGNYFTWSQPGLENRSVAEININTATQQVAIQVHPGAPHYYFSTIYIAVWVRTATGEVLFSQELRGTAPAEASYVSLPFVKGSTVSVLHVESVRSELVNTDTQARYPVKQIQVVRALGDGKLQV